MTSNNKHLKFKYCDIRVKSSATTTPRQHRKSDKKNKWETLFHPDILEAPFFTYYHDNFKA